MKKGGYVDGYVMLVPKKNVKAYQKMAEDGRKLWMKHGALDYKECVADDLKITWVVKPFNKLTKAKSNETVFFSYIVFKSRAHRDAVNKKVHKEIMAYGADKHIDMPFDMKKMSYGGFKVLVGN
jgi:uncharacterized protein YbaA (DUF1428 family)